VAANEIARTRASSCLGREGIAIESRCASVDDLTDVRADTVVVCVDRLAGEPAERIRRLAEKRPELRVVVVAVTFARAAVADALVAGVAGFVLDGDLDDVLPLAVVAASRGQVSLPREFAAAAGQPALSVREKQILALVVMGFSNAEIASKLFVSESTVKSHLSSAFTRLGVRSRNEATAVILDPDNCLGTGILAISGDERRRGRG
jgi:DNA-binding NarL/FixJ family response regulator